MNNKPWANLKGRSGASCPLKDGGIQQSPSIWQSKRWKSTKIKEIFSIIFCYFLLAIVIICLLRICSYHTSLKPRMLQYWKATSKLQVSCTNWCHDLRLSLSFWGRGNVGQGHRFQVAFSILKEYLLAFQMLKLVIASIAFGMILISEILLFW